MDKAKSVLAPKRPPFDQAFVDFVHAILPSKELLSTLPSRLSAIEHQIQDLFKAVRFVAWSDSQPWNPTTLGAPSDIELVPIRFSESEPFSRPVFHGTIIPARYLGTHLFGSYSRATVMNPVESMDVDLLLAFEGRSDTMVYVGDANNFLRAIEEVLTPVQATKHLYEGECVRLDFGAPPLIDVFAAIDMWGHGNAFMFPHGEKNEWYRSNPVLLDELVMRRNRELGMRLTFVLMMLKAWNRHKAVGLRSHHLETMGVNWFTELHWNWAEDLKAFFDAGVEVGEDFLSVPAADGFVVDISVYLTLAEQQSIIEQFREASAEIGAALQAHESGDDRRAINGLSGVFGDYFPSWDVLAVRWAYR